MTQPNSRQIGTVQLKNTHICSRRRKREPQASLPQLTTANKFCLNASPFPSPTTPLVFLGKLPSTYAIFFAKHANLACRRASTILPFASPRGFLRPCCRRQEPLRLGFYRYHIHLQFFHREGHGLVDLPRIGHPNMVYVPSLDRAIIRFLLRCNVFFWR